MSAIPQLAEEAQRRFTALGVNNVEVKIGDALALSDTSKYDRIFLSASD